MKFKVWIGIFFGITSLVGLIGHILLIFFFDSFNYMLLYFGAPMAAYMYSVFITMSIMKCIHNYQTGNVEIA